MKACIFALGFAFTIKVNSWITGKQNEDAVNAIILINKQHLNCLLQVTTSVRPQLQADYFVLYVPIKQIPDTKDPDHLTPHVAWNAC